MAKEILIEHGERKRIIKVIKVSYSTIKAALRCNSTTPLANKIRKFALECVGKLVEY
jgi:hypothetical protein